MSASGRPAIFPIAKDSDASIRATINEKPLSIAVANFNNIDTVTKLTIQASETASILVIVLGILGGILFIFLFISVVCIVKRSREQNSRVESEVQLGVHSNKLSGDEIEKYFPAVLFSSLVEISVHEVTAQNLDKKISEDLDCVICLEKIEGERFVRMGFCKHIFHAECLIGWFKKQRVSDE